MQTPLRASAIDANRALMAPSQQRARILADLGAVLEELEAMFAKLSCRLASVWR